MKVKSNLRAGAGKQKRGSSTDSTDPVYTAPPVPVSRCVGI